MSKIVKLGNYFDSVKLVASAPADVKPVGTLMQHSGGVIGVVGSEAENTGDEMVLIVNAVVECNKDDNTQTFDVGAKVYFVSDDTVSLDSSGGTRPYIGKVVETSPAGVDTVKVKIYYETY